MDFYKRARIVCLVIAALMTVSVLSTVIFQLAYGF